MNRAKVRRLPRCLLLAALLLAGAVLTGGCHGEEGTGSHNEHSSTRAEPAGYAPKGAQHSATSQSSTPGSVPGASRDATGATTVNSGITVENAWARPVTKEMSGMGMSSAAYFLIRNQGGTEDALVGVSTDIGRAEIHESVPVEENHNSHSSDSHGSQGAMKMRPVSRVPVPAGGSVEFRPGGLHIMLMDVKKDLPVGSEFDLTLSFEKGGQKTVRVAVRQP